MKIAVAGSGGAAAPIAGVFSPIRAAPLIMAGLFGPAFAGFTRNEIVPERDWPAPEKRGNSEVWRTNLQ